MQTQRDAFMYHFQNTLFLKIFDIITNTYTYPGEPADALANINAMQLTDNIGATRVHQLRARF